jgi:hypothetical protein
MVVVVMTLFLSVYMEWKATTILTRAMLWIENGTPTGERCLPFGVCFGWWLVLSEPFHRFSDPRVRTVHFGLINLTKKLSK